MFFVDFISFIYYLNLIPATIIVALIAYLLVWLGFEFFKNN